jgi:hypothetical protein
MPNLLEMAVDVMGEVGVPPPVSLFGNTDPRAVSLLALFKREVRNSSLSRTWPSLVVRASFDTVANQEQYALPVGFDSLIPDTVFISNRPARVMGSLDPVAWSTYKSYGSALGVPSFRVLSSNILINPIPTGVETYNYEYKTNLVVVSSTLVGKPTFTADDDSTVLPTALIRMGVVWRYKRSRGLDYADDFVEYNRMVEQRFAQMAATGTLLLGNTTTIDNLTDGYVRDRNFGA